MYITMFFRGFSRKIFSIRKGMVILMETRIIETAERIRALRDIMEISVEDMAEWLGVAPEVYLEYESGGRDFSFTFLYKCADRFGVDIVELLTGEAPKLSFYSIVRKGEGLDMKRRAGFKYEHMAARFKDKTAEPFVVTAPYIPELEDAPLELSYHAGQEFDFVLKGSLRVRFEDHEDILNEGDAAYYDSGRGHGMTAANGEECVFLAVVMKNEPENN